MEFSVKYVIFAIFMKNAVYFDKMKEMDKIRPHLAEMVHGFPPFHE
jgi:hypothetical protein